MNTHLIALLFPKRELAIGNAAVPMLTSIEVPKVEITTGAATKTTGTKATKGHPMPGAIVEVAGVAHCERGLPAQAKRTTPASFWWLPNLC
jgi:hypothetical protein